MKSLGQKLIVILGMLATASFADLARIKAVIVDDAGNRYLFLGENLTSDIEFYRVVRLDKNGTPDREWGTNGVLDLSHIILRNFIKEAQIAITRDGEVLVVGVVANLNHRDHPHMQDLVLVRVKADGRVRKNGDGDLVTKFPFTTKAVATRAITVDDEGRIVVATSDDMGSSDEHLPRIGVVRFTSDCILDRSFNRTGIRYLDLRHDYPNLIMGTRTNIRLMRSGRLMIYAYILDKDGPAMHLLFKVAEDGTRERNVTLQAEPTFDPQERESIPEGMPDVTGKFLYVAHLTHRGKVEIRQFSTTNGQRVRDYGVQVMEWSSPLSTLERSLMLSPNGDLIIVYQRGTDLIVRELKRNGTTRHDTVVKEAFANENTSACRVLMKVSET